MIRKELHNFDTKIFEEFHKNWALLTAGDLNTRNSMTISWGFMGTLWNKPCVIVYVRPTRHTYHLMEENDCFTLSFMDEKYKNEMRFMGTNSGRDYDKFKETGLIPVYEGDSKVSYIKDARFVMKCKTIYSDFIKPELFKEQHLNNQYDEDLQDYHKFYIAEVTSILVEEDEA